MKKCTKAIAVWLALLMIVTALPLSVFAEAGGAETVVKGEFDLVIDNGDSKRPSSGLLDDIINIIDDADVAYPDDMTAAPTRDKYSEGLFLDWDSVLDEEKLTNDSTYIVERNEGSIDASGNAVFKESSWKEISVWDGRQVRVLIVYPNKAAATRVSGWMNASTSDVNALGSGTYSMGLFDITTAPLKDRTGNDYGYDTFNENPDFYLKDENGNYKVDVIFFGTADGNGATDTVKSNGQYGYDGKANHPTENGDISSNAYEAVVKFLATGRGVLFGHDTVTGAGIVSHTNFAKFADELGIAAMSNGTTKNTSDVEVVKQGLLTSFPWAISGKLTVPPTHCMLQLSGGSKLDGTVWMELMEYPNLTNNNYPGAKSNGYLVTNNNVAMIQTGHSNEDATPDEIKVIVNTLFYLMKNSTDSYTIDGDFVDKEAPVITSDSDAIADTVDNVNFSVESGVQYFTADLTFDAEDIGNVYKYRVTSQGANKVNPDENEIVSNEVQTTALADVKGYIIRVDESNAPQADSMISKSATGVVAVTVENDGTAPYTYTAESTFDGNKLKTNTQYYVHIIPVDHANNVGEEVIVPLLQEFTDPTVDTKITPNVSDSDVSDSDVRIEEDVPVLDENGEPVVDEEGNPVTEDITYYYPGNYLDKDNNPFDKDGDDELYEEGERQQDENIVLDITASVEHSNREIIGTVVITDKYGNVIKTIENIEANPSYEFPLEGERKISMKISIDEIYPEECYDEDGKFTATITWIDAADADKENPEILAEDSSKIIVKRPDHKVTFNYKGTDSEQKLDDKQQIQIVKHGEDAKDPGVPKTFKVDKTKYVFDGWDNEFTDIIEDTVVNAIYSEINIGTMPDLPEEEEDPADPPKTPELERLGGETRIETAIEISKRGWDKSDVVILATANEFPDAMAGVPLAKAVDAPILLTVNGESLEEIVKEEIARLSPEKVYILGQTEAVNANIEKELDVLYVIERLGGKDRFGTAVEIAEEMEEVYGEKADAVYFVRSDLFPDALSVSSVAAIEHRPILYVAPNGRVDEPTTAYSKTIGTSATIIGGPDAVIEAGENNIKALYNSVDRIYGKDRYATSVEVCTAKNSLFTGTGTALATGLKFPDALTGGSFAAKNNIPVLLVNGSVSTELSLYLTTRPIKTLFVFGGELAVSDDVAYDALSYCHYLYY